MLYFNSCPKCGTGVIEHTRDPYGDFVQCLHCGFLRDIAGGVNVAQLLPKIRVELARAADTDEAVA